eukprot:Skav207324  [mRNA]  locus=scaffold3027:172303:175330:- [translate_table: standard]
MAPGSDQALEQWLPVIDGLHIGQLVEIEAGPSAGEPAAERGQLINWIPEQGVFEIALLSSVLSQWLVPHGFQQGRLGMVPHKDKTI